MRAAQFEPVLPTTSFLVCVVGGACKNCEKTVAVKVVAQKINVGHGWPRVEISGDREEAALAANIGTESAVAAFLTSKIVELPMTTILKAIVEPNLIRQNIMGN